MSTYNRMGELRDIVPEIRLGGGSHEDHEVSIDMSDFLKDYTKKMDNIELEFSDLKSKFQKIKDLNIKALAATNNKEKKDLKDELKKWITSVSKKNKEISKALQDIAEENEKRRKEMDDENSAEMRIRINQHVQVTNKFKDLIGEYQELQEKFKRENKEKQKRAMKIANPKLSEDEVEVIVSSGMDEDTYKKKLGISKSQQGTVNTYFDDAVETRKDVQQIEGNLIELQDLFISMAQLVATQSELLDNIETSVGIGEEVTRKGLEHVQSTKQHQERSRVIMIIIVVIIILFLLIAFLVGTGVTGGVLFALLRGA